MALRLTKDEAKKAGIVKKGTNPNREEIDRLAYKVIGLLSEASSRTVRTQALKKALKLHLGR